jgi:hypothetical protein
MTDRQSSIKLVAVQMESFTGNVKPGVYDERTIEGLKEIKNSGRKVILVYHNEMWADTANELCNKAGLDGSVISPEYVMQSAQGAMTRKQMLASFGANPEESLFVGHDLTDAIAAGAEGMYALQIEGVYLPERDNAVISRAIRNPQRLHRPWRN